MPKIYVKTPFTLTHDDTSKTSFAVGEHEVDAEVADHWFTKLHTGEKPVAAGTPVSLPAGGSDADQDDSAAELGKREEALAANAEALRVRAAELEVQRVNLGVHKAELDARHGSLEERAAGLNAREAELDAREDAIATREAALAAADADKTAADKAKVEQKGSQKK